MQQFLNIIFTTSFAHSILRISTSLIYAGMAAVVAERVGVSNIGIEGMMLTAALTGVIFSAFTQNALVGLVCAILAGMLISLIMSYFILNLKTHNVMSGLSVNMLAKGLTIFVLFALTGNKGASIALKSVNLPKWNIPLVQNIPVLGEIISGQNVLTYLAFVCVLLVSLFLYRTKSGVHIRAVGESPEAAKSVGIPVSRVQYTALLISGGLAGVAGAYLSMGHMDGFTANMTSGRGFIALAACSMGQTTPWGTLLAALIFGVADALSNSLQVLRIPAQFVQMIPYVVTILGIALYSIQKAAQKKKSARMAAQNNLLPAEETG
ncbi:MAG: ABC transporter permease [Oscillospiraceae bacterium]